MPSLEILEQRSSEVLGRIVLEGAEVTFSNSWAERLFRSKSGFYRTDAEAFRGMAESSNGYISFRLAE